MILRVDPLEELPQGLPNGKLLSIEQDVRCGTLRTAHARQREVLWLVSGIHVVGGATDSLSGEPRKELRQPDGIGSAGHLSMAGAHF